jgi:hypothetical protein
MWLVFICMDKHLEFISIVKDIVHSTTLDELKDCVVKGNEFLKEYELSQDSPEFKKLSNVVTLMKMKLKSKKKFQNEGRTYTISESKLISFLS